MKKLTFNKASVLLMYIMVIGIFAFCFITQQYPPAEFTYCWFGFWIAQAAITCILQINKRKDRHKTEDRISFWEAITPYINADNADKLIERYIGIEPNYKKKKEDIDNEE